MKKLFIAVLLLTSTMLFSQSLNLKLGQEEKEARNQSLFIGGNGEIYYTVDFNEDFNYEGYSTLSNYNKSCFLNKYSATDNKLIFHKQIDFPEIEKKSTGLFEFIYLKGKLYMFFSRFIDKTKIHKLFYAKVNDDGTLSTDYKLIDEMPESKYSAGYFIVQLSVDKTEILAFHETPWAKKQNAGFSCKVFDENMTQKWSKNIDLPYKSEKCVLSQQVRLNGGNFYLFGYDLVSTTNLDDKTIRNKVICYNPKTDKTTEGEIVTPYKTIWDVRFKFSKTGNLICAGLATNKDFHGYGPTGNKLHAIFYYEFDKNIESTISKQVKDMEADLVGMFGNWNYYLKNIVLLNDKITIVCQQDYTNLARTGKIGTKDREANFHSYYQDLMILTFDTKSTAYWIKRIKQNQTDQPLFGSFLLLSNDKSFSILINAKKEEVNYSPPENQKDFDFSDLKEKGNVTINFNFNSDGKIKIENAFDEKTNGVVMLYMNNYLINKEDEAYINLKTSSGAKAGALLLNK